MLGGCEFKRLLDVVLDFPVSRLLPQRTGVSVFSRWLIFGWLISTISSHFGDPSDYDEWARLSGEGAESWAYKDFHKSANFFTFRKRANWFLP
jgi:hypothetical protein